MSERSYRPALDGLRAVAVGAVILYHLGYRWIPGGFLGVDLFFVLSGYLITELLLAEYGRRGRIDFAAFYIRRLRRLMPALLLMALAVAAGVRWLEPAWHWSDRRGDLIATLFYAANWHFIATDQSYFAEFAAQSPLRHAWSLSIEEQFYLVWPVLILLALKYARRWLSGLLLLATAASALTMIAVYSPTNPTRAYAGTDARAQQLMIGALLAVLAVRRVRWAGWLWAPAAAVTIGLLLVVHDSHAFYYRGGATLVAVVFAVLLRSIDQAPGSPLARLLSVPPVAWMGRISYGLYLWHWPVFLFFPNTRVVAKVAVVFALATASYYLVERPIRQGRPRFAVGTRASMAATAPLALGLCTVLVVGATSYAGERQAQQVAQVGETPAFKKACPDQGDILRICERVPAPQRGFVMAVLGDSVARSLDPGFVQLAHRRGWGYLLAASNGCGISGLLLTTGPSDLQRNCAVQESQRVRQLLARYHPNLVVTVARKELSPHVTAAGTVAAPPSPAWAADVQAGLTDMARTVTDSGAQLAMVSVFDRTSGSDECLTHPDTPGCAMGPDPRTEATNAIYREVAREIPQVQVISMQDVVCPGGSCPVRLDGQVLRYDGVHFTAPGARWFVDRLEPRLVAAADVHNR